MANLPNLAHLAKVNRSADTEKSAHPEADHARRATRIGLWALGAGFGLFMLWAAIAPLDEGVPSQGMIAVDTKRRPVQHLSGGIVKQVLVGEGAVVKQGQLLIKLEDANAKAGFEAIRQRYLGLRAMQGRLMAEQTGRSKVQFHPDLEAAASDPLIAQQMRNQEMLLQTRQSALQAELQSLEESIQGQEVSIQTLEAILQNRRGQLALLTDELNNTRNLVKDGYAPRNRQLELERMVAESSSAIADSQGNILRSKRSIAELRQRAILRKQEYRKEVESQIADITREVLGDAEKFRAAKEELARTEIYSPADGQVVSLVTQAAGAVIGAGQKLMDIVPTGQPLMLETKVLPHMIDRVQAGMVVDVRFSSFSHTPQLVVDGKVLSVSSDVLVDTATQQPYFLARVTVTPEGLKTLGNRQMQPGMPVEVVFKTGERSLLTYLLSPLTKRVAASMKEE